MTQPRFIALLRATLIPLILLLAGGCATTQSGANKPDTFEPVNRVGYNINDSLDNTLLKPIAETYAENTPQFVRTGITNFFDNLGYLNVVLNSLLQGKFDQAITDALRFTYNSTFGIAGLFDVSTPIGMPANNEDFGQTLEAWGFDEGSFLYIPVYGPNTTGNVPNMVTSALLNPLTYVTSTVLFPLSAINIINKRANLLEATRIRDEAAVDPYTFTREAYMQQREYFIHDGNPPVEGYDDIFEGGDSDGAAGEEGVLRIE